MNAVLYHVNSHKKINGTLFYCFEYYSLLKQYIPDLKFILLNTTNEDMSMIRDIFVEKYLIDNVECINLVKITDFARLPIKNLLILDINSYKKIKDFSFKIKNIRIYSNDTHEYLNKKHNHIFYGWYNYQKYNFKTRLKLFKQLHKTFEHKGTKTLVTSLHGDFTQILKKLNLKEQDVYVKKLNSHNPNLFENINKLIYWHSGNFDTNNRSLIEACLHNLKLEVYLNGYETDSIKERYDMIQQGNIADFWLDENDILIRDFIDDCTNS